MAHQKPHPFLPQAGQSPKFLKWLRRTHAWFGVFGAAAGILFAVTAITLSHHNFGVDTTPETTRSTIPVPSNVAIDSEESLAAFVKQELGLSTNFQPGMGAGGRAMGMANADLKNIQFRRPSDIYAISYTLGDPEITVQHTQRGFLETINRMHRGEGVPLGWVILGDIFAFGFIFLAISGVLLWTRAHGGRLAALGLLSITAVGSAYYLTASA